MHQHRGLFYEDHFMRNFNWDAMPDVQKPSTVRANGVGPQPDFNFTRFVEDMNAIDGLPTNRTPFQIDIARWNRNRRQED